MTCSGASVCFPPLTFAPLGPADRRAPRATSQAPPSPPPPAPPPPPNMQEQEERHEVIFRERDATESITPAAAVMPLGAAMTSLLAAPEVEFALAIGSSEPDANSAAVKALRSIEAHLRSSLTGTTVWSLVEPLIDQSVGKKRGGRRHRHHR